MVPKDAAFYMERCKGCRKISIKISIKNAACSFFFEQAAFLYLKVIFQAALQFV